MTVHDGAEDTGGRPAMTLLDVRIRYAPRLVMIRLAGDLDLSSVHRLRDTVGSVAATGCPATLVVLDLGGITFCDIAGLEALEGAAASLREAGKELMLSAVPDRVLTLMELTGVALAVGRR